MPHHWKIVKSNLESENRIFSLRTDRFISPRTGFEHDFFILEAGDWVNIIPLTSTGDVLLVKQFRHASREFSLEIPGGIIDPGEKPEEAGVRELMEETGFKGTEVTCLGRVRPNPAILTNWCYTFLARDVVYHGPIKLDGTEDVELVRVRLAAIPGMIARGEIDHALVVAAFFHYFGAGGFGK